MTLQCLFLLLLLASLSRSLPVSFVVYILCVSGSMLIFSHFAVDLNSQMKNCHWEFWLNGAAFAASPRVSSRLVEGAWEGDVFCLESLVEKCANGSPVDPVLDISSDVDVDASCAACTNFAWKLQFSKCGRAVRGNRGRHCAKEGMWNCMCFYAAESSI